MKNNEQRSGEDKNFNVEVDWIPAKVEVII